MIVPDTNLLVYAYRESDNTEKIDLKIRIQSRDIEVPPDDPFKNDLLNRKEAIEVLTNIVRSIDGPCTLAVDAPWGAGKTTFINIWTQVLRNERFPVVAFNAWETDFSNDPFVALSEEITQGVREYSEDSLSGKIDDLRKKASEVAIRSVPLLVRATMGALGLNPPLEEASKILTSYAEDRLKAHVEERESLENFREILQETAHTLAHSNDGLPLVIVIDELDRCRPSYAVELLEVAKHIFSVDHIVFVLAVNRSELAHSVCALYGNSFDGPDYLKRFFDLDFRLPDPERKQFIESALSAIEIDEYFNRTRDNVSDDVQRYMREMLLHFLGTPSLSIRTIGQTIHRMGLILASLRSDHRVFGLATVVTLIIRSLDLDLYHRFIRGEASDEEIVNRIFRLTESEYLRETYRWDNPGLLFEALVIRGCREVSKAYSDGNEQRAESTLREQYTEFLSERGEQVENESPYSYAKAVLNMSRIPPHSFDQNAYGFRCAIDRIELISEELLGDDA